MGGKGSKSVTIGSRGGVRGWGERRFFGGAVSVMELAANGSLKIEMCDKF